jgi:hypothetical protein
MTPTLLWRGRRQIFQANAVLARAPRQCPVPPGQRPRRDAGVSALTQALTCGREGQGVTSAIEAEPE